MTFKKFDVLIIIQLLLIAANNFAIAWTIIQEHLIISTVYLLIILIFQVVFLFLFITKQSKEVIRFLESMKHRDEFSRLSEKDTRSSQRQLRRLLNEIAESYSKVKIEKESEHFYFLNTIKHLNVGLISFDEQGKVELMNEAAEKLLKVDKAKHISQLNEILETSGFSFTELDPGKPKLIRFTREGEVLQLSLHATTFFIKDHRIILVSIQDIRNEIQQEEIQIWQKLIRVLTHEIMNSAGPITSLSSTLTDTFKEDIKPHKIGEKLYDQVLIGLQAIQKRSRGLAKFVETYRNLTKLPDPVFTTVHASELLKHLKALMQDEIEKQDVALYFEVPQGDMKLKIDEKMFTQVLINLVHNAIEALKGLPNKSIRISIRESENNGVVLTVEDNGKGIPEEVLERVFVPFFTTREEGSGIGLSLSRQIISLHGGAMNIRSKEGNGTIVEILF